MDSRAIRDQVERILQSRTFATKNQLKKLLDILLENLDCQSNLSYDLVISELWPNEVRTKRPADVATEINRLRHALETYYKDEGQDDPIAIYLPNRATRTGNGSHETRWIAARTREPVPCSATPATEAAPASHPGRIRYIAIAIAAMALLSAGAYILTGAGNRPQPRFGRVDGAVLHITAADGKELWSKTFPEGIGPDWYYAPSMGPRLWFADLEGKGEISVLFAYSPASQQPHSITLICYSSRGREKWRWTPDRALPELDGSPAIYRIDALEVLRKTERAPARIVVACPHALWWPSQIAILDPSGKLLS